MLLRRIELVEFVASLQLSKQQLNLPATPGDRCQITRAELASRQVRDVQVVVVVVLVANADDAKELRITRMPRRERESGACCLSRPRRIPRRALRASSMERG